MQNPARRPHACSILLVFERERYCDLIVIFVTRPELVRSNLNCLHFHKKTSSEAVRLVEFHPQACKKYDDVIFTRLFPAVLAFAGYIIVFIFLLVEQ
jgi:hypothetical protein